VQGGPSTSLAVELVPGCCTRGGYPAGTAVGKFSSARERITGASWAAAPVSAGSDQAIVSDGGHRHHAQRQAMGRRDEPVIRRRPSSPAAAVRMRLRSPPGAAEEHCAALSGPGSSAGSSSTPSLPSRGPCRGGWSVVGSGSDNDVSPRGASKVWWGALAAPQTTGPAARREPLRVCVAGGSRPVGGCAGEGTLVWLPATRRPIDSADPIGGWASLLTHRRKRLSR